METNCDVNDDQNESDDGKRPFIPEERSGKDAGLTSTTSSSGQQSNSSKSQSARRDVSITSANSSQSQVASRKGEEFVIGYHSLGVLDDNTDIPNFVKEHNATLTFPEKLMLMLTHVERECAKKGIREEDESVGWILEGKAFAIRSTEKFSKTWLPLFFAEAKYQSFTRKLYRWGFRKVNLDFQSTISQHYFGNEHFQRNNRNLLSRMRSVTAQKTREATLAQNLKQTSSPKIDGGTSQSGQAALLQPSIAPNLQQQPNVNLPNLPQNVTTDQLLFIQQALAYLQNSLGLAGQGNHNQGQLLSQNETPQQQHSWEQQQQQIQPQLPQTVEQQQVLQIGGQAVSNLSSAPQLPMNNTCNELLLQLSQIASQQTQAQSQLNVPQAARQSQQILSGSESNTQNTRSATMLAAIHDQQAFGGNHIQPQSMGTQSQSQLSPPALSSQSQFLPRQSSPRFQPGQEGESQVNGTPSQATNVALSHEMSANMLEQFRQSMDTFLRQNQSGQPPPQGPKPSE